MIRSFLKRQLDKNRELIWKEAADLQGFMQLLMKPRNTKIWWTKEEKKALKTYLKYLSAFVPVLFILLLPGGLLLLPFLAGILDRRKKKRNNT